MEGIYALLQYGRWVPLVGVRTLFLYMPLAFIGDGLFKSKPRLGWFLGLAATVLQFHTLGFALLQYVAVRASRALGRLADKLARAQSIGDFDATLLRFASSFPAPSAFAAFLHVQYVSLVRCLWWRRDRAWRLIDHHGLCGGSCSALR